MRTVPVVVISALDEIDSVVRAIEMGAEDYLFKPFDPVLLRARIGALLERKRLVQELAVQAKLASMGVADRRNRARNQESAEFRDQFRATGRGIGARATQADRRRGNAFGRAAARDCGSSRRILPRTSRRSASTGRAPTAIIGSMLAHSRGQPGERRPTDLNALVRDYVNLAFHGMRAQDNTFQVAIEGDYDPNVGMVDVVPQDLSRVFLERGEQCLLRRPQEGAAGDRRLSTGDPRRDARSRRRRRGAHSR